MIKVRDQKIDEAVFMKMREQELSAWPTGREVDLAEVSTCKYLLVDEVAFFVQRLVCLSYDDRFFLVCSSFRFGFCLGTCCR